MWRLWKAGWGVRAWWHWFNDQGWPMWIAWHLPRRAALWTFIRVYAWDGQAPGEEYRRVYAAWEAGEAGRYKPVQIPPGFVGEGSTAQYIGPPAVSGLGYDHGQRREPIHIDLADPRFDVLWNRLKHLDITGNDIATLLDELDAAPTLGV